MCREEGLVGSLIRGWDFEPVSFFGVSVGIPERVWYNENIDKIGGVVSLNYPD